MSRMMGGGQSKNLNLPGNRIQTASDMSVEQWVHISPYGSLYRVNVYI